MSTQLQPTSIILADRPIPQIGPLDIQVKICATLNLSAEDARRKVNRLVHHEISYLMKGGGPSLVIADRVYWRVPVMLAFPSYGTVGAVGSVDVDVTTGEINISPRLIAEIQHRAQNFTPRTAPHTAPTG